jgi:predicted membrane channel-forming protein YqfA (hemolysin III family)
MLRKILKNPFLKELTFYKLLFFFLFMGAIRGILIVFASVFLLLSFFCMILLLVLSSSLDYQFVETESSAILKNVFESSNFTSQIEKFYPMIQLYCQNNTEYVFTVDAYTINIPCSVVIKGNDAILEEGIKNVINQIYYKEYDCGFLDCIKSTEVPTFLISKKSHDFFDGKFYIFLLISLALSAILFFLVEKKANMPILAGIFLALSSLPFIKLDILFSSLSNEMASKFLKIFFSQSFPVAIKLLIFGIILIILGIVFKMFKVGLFISDLISKITKKSVEEKSKTLLGGNKPTKSSEKAKSK